MNDTVLIEKTFELPTYKTFKREIEGSTFECPCRGETQLEELPKVSNFIDSLEFLEDSACRNVFGADLTSDALNNEDCLFSPGPYRVARVPHWLQSLHILCGKVKSSLRRALAPSSCAFPTLPFLKC